MKKRNVLVLIFFTVLIAACKPTQQLESPTLEETPRLVIMSAFGAELSMLQQEADLTGTYDLNGTEVQIGKLYGQDVALMLSGTSMINAAMNAQAVIDHFNVQGIVFSGIAGGVNPNLNIGDVVIPAQWGEYQEALFARETNTGWDTGWHTRDFGNYGMIFPQYVSVPENQANGYETKFWFAADEEMLAVAEDAVRIVALSTCTSQDNCLTNEPVVVVGGNGVSGPTFVDNADYRVWVWETFEADVLDMESAAVAHVAYVNDVPFLAFRSLSDLAGGGAGENEINVFYQLAADNAAKVLLAFLDTWAE
ncbi:MAG: 5'-methylthioadenosine/S-adenosylhomocysteine nucleosidase [Anaerolineales bacterium]|nr:5'-methylthioadenosine/S-adenosylhomocysteine nucleosidase [Anaerolineales bacterium]